MKCSLRHPLLVGSRSPSFSQVVSFKLREEQPWVEVHIGDS